MAPRGRRGGRRRLEATGGDRRRPEAKPERKKGLSYYKYQKAHRRHPRPIEPATRHPRRSRGRLACPAPAASTPRSAQPQSRPPPVSRRVVFRGSWSCDVVRKWAGGRRGPTVAPRGAVRAAWTRTREGGMRREEAAAAARKSRLESQQEARKGNRAPSEAPAPGTFNGPGSKTRWQACCAFALLSAGGNQVIWCCSLLHVRAFRTDDLSAHF